MSIPHKQTVKCPKCGEEIEFTLWQSINTEMDFAIPDIISGKLFEVECKKCGYKTHVNYPMLFNDMIHNVMIYSVAPDSTEETEKALDSLKKMYPGRTRIVTDQSTLREKTAIFNAGLDDRVTEILKLIIMAQLQEQLSGQELVGVFFVPGDEPKFEIAFKDGSGYVPVTKEMYENLASQFNDKLSAGDDEYYIDQDWAMAFLSSPDNQLQ
jgi:predicted nucleic-acid-binding Zn-ribbon protein